MTEGYPMSSRVRRWFVDRDGLTLRGLFTVIGLVLVLVFSCGVGVSLFTDRQECRSIASTSGLATRYDFWAGCFVHVDGQWTPLDRWEHMTGTPR